MRLMWNVECGMWNVECGINRLTNKKNDKVFNNSDCKYNITDDGLDACSVIVEKDFSGVYK